MSCSVFRRLMTLCAALVASTVTSLILAGRAAADTPEGWEQADPVNPVHTLLVLAGIPILLFVVIAIGVYLPSMLRGESLAPGTASPEDAWLGGPRKPAGELSSADADQGGSGGAGSTW